MIIRRLKQLGMAVAVGASALAPLPSQAIPVELALVIDASGSIGLANFTTQMNGYAAALTNVFAANPSLYGNIAIGVWTFNGGVTNNFITAIITNVTALNALNAAITGAIAAYVGGSTAIGNAIAAASAQLLGNGIVSDRQIIDVSTDGVNNVGPAPGPVAAAAVVAGIEQVNCLGIGASANCGFIAGAGSFSLAVPNFAAIQAALEAKIPRETGQVPEPATLALLGLGLAALGLARRRAA